MITQVLQHVYALLHIPHDKLQTVASWLHFHVCVTYQTSLLEEPDEDGKVSIEQSIENQAPTPNSSLTEAETGENSPDGGETFDHGNEIITPTDDLLAHGPAIVQPTQDNFVKDTSPKHPQAEEEKPGEVNELVEDTAGTAGRY